MKYLLFNNLIPITYPTYITTYYLGYIPTIYYLTYI
jgi:hypothetical protein